MLGLGLSNIKTDINATIGHAKINAKFNMLTIINQVGKPSVLKKLKTFFIA